MSEELVREIARQIAEQQFEATWPLYVCIIVLTLVAGFAGNFIGEYAKKRGEHLATKADFESLVEQLKQTTRVAEEVRSHVAHIDWAARELKVLKRQKLEELIRSIRELQDWQEADKDFRIYNSATPPNTSPLPTVEFLVALYFPELHECVDAYTFCHRKAMVMTIQTHSELLAVKGNALETARLIEKYGVDWLPFYTEQIDAIKQIDAQARELMKLYTGES